MDKAHNSSATNDPMGRVGLMQELRNLATFLMADGCDYLTGEPIVIDGGALLGGGGTCVINGKYAISSDTVIY